MKVADLDEVRRLVTEMVRNSEFSEQFRAVTVNANDEETEGGAFLRVMLETQDTAHLDFQRLLPFVRLIEDRVAEIDDRFPSVRFPEAA